MLQLNIFRLDNSEMLKVYQAGSRNKIWDFPGGPVVRTPCFHCRGHGFDPWNPGSGTKIPQATWYGQKQTNKQKVIKLHFCCLTLPLNIFSLKKQNKYKQTNKKKQNPASCCLKRHTENIRGRDFPGGPVVG